MATINVLDAVGATVALEKPLVPGRAAAAASRPVALSSEDVAFLDGIEAALATLDGRVDGLETLVASTNTKLDTVNTNLGTIDGRVDGLETAVASTNTKLDTLNTRTAGGALTNRSGTITTGGTSQTLAASNSARKYLFVQNPSTQSESLFVNFTSAALLGTSYELLPGGSLEMSAPNFVSTELVTVIAATTAHPFAAKEG